MKKYILWSVIFGVMLSQQAHAQDVGVYGAGVPDVISTMGMNPVAISDFSIFDLSTVDILWIFNSDNNAYDSAVTGRSGELNTFVSNGGQIMFYDRAIGNLNPTFLPGLSSITTVRQDISDVDILTTNAITDGPAGFLDNLSLDTGDTNIPIAVGYITSGAPSGAITTFNVAGNAAHAIDINYTWGAGAVYYAGIPLDAYLNAGGGSGHPDRLSPGNWQTNLVDVYTPNTLGLVASGSVGVSAPEPGSLLLLGLGAIGFVTKRRKNN
jgi:PEP-CTERM motif